MHIFFLSLIRYLCYFLGKHLFYSHLSKVCPQCQQRDTLTLSPLPGFIIVVNQKGNTILPENCYSCHILQLSGICITNTNQLFCIPCVFILFSILEAGFNPLVKLTYWCTLHLSVNPSLKIFSAAMGWIRLQFVRHCISFKGTCLFTSNRKKNWS